MKLIHRPMPAGFSHHETTHCGCKPMIQECATCRHMIDHGLSGVECGRDPEPVLTTRGHYCGSWAPL